MRGPLALLLAIAFELETSCRCTFARSACQQTRLGKNAGEVAVDGVQAMLAWSQDSVGMLNVGPRQILDTGLEGSKCNDDLLCMSVAVC